MHQKLNFVGVLGIITALIGFAGGGNARAEISIILTRPTISNPQQAPRMKGYFETLAPSGVRLLGSVVVISTETGRDIAIPFFTDYAARAFAESARRSANIDLTACQRLAEPEGVEPDSEAPGCWYYSSRVLFQCGLFGATPRVDVPVTAGLSAFERSQTRDPIQRLRWDCPNDVPAGK